MDTRSIVGGLTDLRSTYLGSVGSDFGGSKASELGPKSAERYLSSNNRETGFSLKVRVIGASVISAAILVADAMDRSGVITLPGIFNL